MLVKCFFFSALLVPSRAKKIRGEQSLGQRKGGGHKYCLTLLKLNIETNSLVSLAAIEIQFGEIYTTERSMYSCTRDLKVRTFRCRAHKKIQQCFCTSHVQFIPHTINDKSSTTCPANKANAISREKNSLILRHMDRRG